MLARRNSGLGAPLIPASRGLRPVQPDGDGAAMGGQPLRFGERQRRRAQVRERLGIAGKYARALEKVQHRQSGRKPRRTRGRQNVVGSGDVVADRFGRVSPKKRGTGMMDPREKGFRIGGGNLEMFGRDSI